MKPRRKSTRASELLGRAARSAARMGKAAAGASEAMRLLGRAMREAEAQSALRARRARARGRRRKVAAWKRRNDQAKAPARLCSWGRGKFGGHHRAAACYVRRHQGL